MSVGLPAAHRIFDVVFLLVVIFTLVQGPTLPWVARRLGSTAPENPRQITIESAPLDAVGATLLQFEIPRGSRIAGVEVSELRLPPGAAVSLVLRGGEVFAPISSTVLRTGDHVLVAAARDDHRAIADRLRSISERGRLAGWYSTFADRPQHHGASA